MPTPDEGLIPPGRATGRAGARTNTAPTSSDTDLVAKLTLHEKVLLLTGADSWSTQGADLLGLRPMTMSDGPAGARGVTLDERRPSTSLPCPSALGATWDPELVRELAAALGVEARGKGIDVLLGPTINLMRSPLGGRGFEYFGEDPVLITRIAASYVRGLQGAGVAATVKHYVCNDTETQRWSYDARIAEHVLRELYLMPFEACVKDADAALVMAAYNMVNGTPMTENAALLKGVLKGEWAFRGVVTSDWHAARSTTATALATLDLSMPGPDGPWGERLAQAVADGIVTENVLDDKIVRLLGLARRVGALHCEDRDADPVHGAGHLDGRAAETPSAGNDVAGTVDHAVDPALLRRATTASFVLLRNDDHVLPLRGDTISRLAVLGPGAVRPTIQGGGSAIVAPAAHSTPAHALTARMAGLMADAEVTVAEGCQIWSTVPEPPAGWLRDPVTGKPGVHLEFAAADGTVLRTEHRSATTLAWWDGVPPGIGWGEGGSIVLHASFLPDWTGPYVIGAAGVGHLTITVDGVVVADRPTAVPHDPVEAMTRPGQVRAGLELQAGREVSLRVRFRPAADGEGPLGMRLGIERALDDDATLAAAVDAARNSDVAVVVVGSAELTESEGFDRTSLRLPGRQDDLVSQVAAANPRTVVVINSGMPVLMPWASDVAAIIQAWLPGQCMGEALADVLFGDAEPGGRLPVTLPVSEADCPVLDATPVNGVLEYGEGLLVGYRGYDAQGVTPLFPFGHGLGYTSWDYEVASALTTDYRPGRDLDLRVVVRNTGPRHGKEVIQAYLAGPPGEPGRPMRALAAFAVAWAGPGERAEVALQIPARLFARWDTDLGTWIWPGVPFTVQVGRSSRDLPLSLPVPAR
jgi:beta-glucosidase